MAAASPRPRRRRLGRGGPAWWLCGLLIAVAPVAAGVVPSRGVAGQPGLTAGNAVARAYDTILDADFAAVPARVAATCGPAPRVACLGLTALATWWEIVLDPDSRALDARFTGEVEAAIADAADWTRREPERAETWFYLGAALGARGQWRILREERVAAARDGKRIKEALEQALLLDPAMHDAEFGLGVYRYYAGVAPAYLRWLRWLLLLPGGDRIDGLARMERASRLGEVVASEADYQLHQVYLWYEQRAPDALAKIVALQQRFPHNPLFRHLEARIHDVYLRDARASLAASQSLLALAERGAVHRAALAATRARLNIAVQLDRLGDRPRAIAMLNALFATGAQAPIDAITEAQRLRRAWRAR
jgi:hypothetical protein